jgi:hypothetical protein
MSFMLPTYITMLDTLVREHEGSDKLKLKTALEELFVMTMNSQSLSSVEKLIFECRFLETCEGLGLMP